MARAGIVPERSVTVVACGGDSISADLGGRVVVLPLEVAQRVFLVGLANAAPGPVQADVESIPREGAPS
jgi:hypothetical protein